MTSKLRPIRFHIQPEVVADDGETLTPVPINPFAVDAADLDDFPSKWKADLAVAEATFNGAEEIHT